MVARYGRGRPQRESDDGDGSKGEPRWTVHTEITIDAPSDRVWQVITDFDSMRTWATGALQQVEPFIADQPVRVDFKSGPYTMKMDRKLTIVDGTSFEWSGPYMAGLADHHVYTLEPTPDGKRAYARWNAELKAEVERRNPPETRTQDRDEQ